MSEAIDRLTARVVKPEIKTLQRIKDTSEDRFDYLRLDKNERIIPFTEPQLEDFRKRIVSADLSGYPEFGAILRRLATYLGVDAHQILLANGSDLAIKSAYEACIDRNDNVVVHLPSYAMHRVYAAMLGARPIGVPMRADWSLDLDAMLATVDGKTKMLVIENPNGFVGTQPTLDDIERAAKELAAKDVLLLVDEAYYYIENDRSRVSGLMERYPNVLLSQTFSKCHGIAGTRFGFLVGHRDLMAHIGRVRPMHEVTSLTAVAADWILDHPEILDDYRRAIQESKTYLLQQLDALGIRYRDAHANFILLNFVSSGITIDMAKEFEKRKILVRRPFQESSLRGWIRLTTGSLEDSRAFITAVQSILGR